jgi:hypothetical protein
LPAWWLLVSFHHGTPFKAEMGLAFSTARMYLLASTLWNRKRDTGKTASSSAAIAARLFSWQGGLLGLKPLPLGFIIPPHPSVLMLPLIGRWSP